MKTKEESIKKLIKLAKIYQNYFRGKLPLNNHNYLSDDWKKEKHIDIYFGDDYSTCALYFNNIEVALYNNKFTVPFNITNSKLEKTIDFVVDFLHTYKSNYSKSIKDEIEAQKQARIESLKKELEELQKENL